MTEEPVLIETTKSASWNLIIRTKIKINRLKRQHQLSTHAGEKAWLKFFGKTPVTHMNCQRQPEMFCTISACRIQLFVNCGQVIPRPWLLSSKKNKYVSKSLKNQLFIEHQKTPLWSYKINKSNFDTWALSSKQLSPKYSKVFPCIYSFIK